MFSSFHWLSFQPLVMLLSASDLMVLHCSFYALIGMAQRWVKICAFTLNWSTLKHHYGHQSIMLSLNTKNKKIQMRSDQENYMDNRYSTGIINDVFVSENQHVAFILLHSRTTRLQVRHQLIHPSSFLCTLITISLICLLFFPSSLYSFINLVGDGGPYHRKAVVLLFLDQMIYWKLLISWKRSLFTNFQ